LSSFVAFIILVGGSTLAAITGLFFVRRKWANTVAHHEVGGYMLSILGTLYAVVLGFVVVNVSESVQQVKMTIATEANSLLNIYRFADGLPAKNKEELAVALLEYSDAVADKEWDLMIHGILCPDTWRAQEHIWQALKNCKPQSNQEQAFYNSILDNFSSMLTARRTRLVQAGGFVSPVLWLVLIGGGVATISFTYFFSTKSLRAQMAMTALVTITLALNLYLVVVNSSPFEGEFRIRPVAYRIASKILSLKGAAPPIDMLNFKRDFFGRPQETRP
jgi:hypothetical protein